MNAKGGKTAVAPTRSRKKILSWVDTPDEVYFVADTSTRYAFEKSTSLSAPQRHCHSGAFSHLQWPVTET